ncbi:PAS domain-containing protein [bacterium]|nr:PAS domain-containing protein [bacterium]
MATDSQGRVVYANPAAARILGVTRAEMLGPA